MVNRAQLSKIHVKLREARMTDPADALQHISVWADREITSTKNLTAAEASAVLTGLDEFIAAEAEAAAAERRDAEEGSEPDADD